MSLLRSPRAFRSSIAVVALSLIAMLGAAADWPQWRGAQRDGRSPETGLLKTWPASGPPLAWKVGGLGEGFAGLSVAGGRIYTQGQEGDRQFVIAVEEASGRKLWQTHAGRAFRESRGHGPRGTPTVDGNRIYALAADGTLSALDAASGKAAWTMNIVDKFGGRVPNWGISESPLVDGNRLIVTPGGQGAGVVALDKNNGNVLWQALSDRAGYSSPIAVDISGVRQIVVFTGDGVAGLRADNGAALWRYDRVANRVANIATPIHRDGHLFVSSDYGTGCALVRPIRSGDAWRPEEIYFSREMRNHYSSSVLVGDHLYGFSSTILTAMTWKTGDVAWKDRSVGKGSVAYADGHLYLLSEEGVVGLAEATPDGYREKSRFNITRPAFPTWTPPVIANGRMLLRAQDTLYAFDVRAK